MVDGGHRNVDELATVTVQGKDGHLEAGRPDVATKLLTADRHDGFRSLRCEFDQRATESQHHVDRSITDREIVTWRRAHHRNGTGGDECVTHPLVAHDPEVSTDGDDQPGESMSSLGRDTHRTVALGEVDEPAEQTGFLGSLALEPPLPCPGPSGLVDAAIGDPFVEPGKRLGGTDLDALARRAGVRLHGVGP